MPSFKYKVSDPTGEFKETLEAIPGIKAFRDGYKVPENAAAIASQLLFDVPHHVEQPWTWNEPVAPEAIEGLRPWVPAFLTPYQREAIDLGIRKGSLMFVHPTGSGKTLSAICWALASPGLIVVITKAAVRLSFANEVRRYTTIEPLVLSGESPVVLAGSRIIICGWENLPAHIETILRMRPQSVVFDEIHKGKSHSRWTMTHDDAGKPAYVSKQNQARAAERLSKAAKRRLGTTATPVRNRLKDLWAQLDLLNPWEFGSFWDFAKRYCALRQNQYGGWDANGTSNADELRGRLGYVMHVVPYHVTHRELPPKRRIVTRVPVAEQNAAGAFARDIRAAAKRGRVSLLEVRLAEAASRKRKFLLQMVGDSVGAAQKVVIFTGRRADCDKIGEAIGKEWPEVARWVGHGEYSQEDRATMTAAYMAAPGPAVLVATGDAFGEGLNLQDTDLAIFAMLPYTAGQITQWEGRFSRLGQTRPVLVQYLMAEGTVDEHVAQIILDKLPATESVAGGDALTGLYDQLRGDSDLLITELTDVVLGHKVDSEDEGI